MLLQWLAGAVALVIGTLLDGLEGLVPAEVFGFVETFASQLGYLLSFGPASAIGVLVVCYYAVDLGLNAYVFAVTTYRLIPAKAT
jgi:hypothetical protein